MTQWISFVLLVVAATIAVTESRAIPAEPVMLDPYGNPIVFLREKRTPVQPYPHRTMMIAGYYRPVRRSNPGSQATGVFAQGNAVSGEAFFGGMQAPHLNNGPEPIEDSEVSSAEAQAAPEPEESYNEETPLQQEEEHQPEGHHRQDEHQPEGHHRQDEHQPGGPNHQDGHQPGGSNHQDGQQPGGHNHQDGHQPEGHHRQDEHHYQPEQQDPQEEYPVEEEQHHHKQATPPPQEEPQPEPAPSFPTEAAPVTPANEHVHPTPEAPANRPKVHHGKKAKKPPVVVEEDDEEDDEYDEEEVSVPFVPFKGNRRRQNYPNLNNYFPMVFSFPGVSTRSGSSGSPPGAVTAIANSYSTGKGGVASSVATAYGGSPNGKKKRPATTEE